MSQLHPVLQVLHDRWLDRLPPRHELLGNDRHLWIMCQGRERAAISLSADHSQLRIVVLGQWERCDLADPDCIQWAEARLYTRHLLGPGSHSP